MPIQKNKESVLLNQVNILIGFLVLTLFIRIFVASRYEINWDEFQRVISGSGPCNRQRLKHHISADNEGEWVRQAMDAYNTKKCARRLIA
mgnify:CR=1 FL=1